MLLQATQSMSPLLTSALAAVCMCVCARAQVSFFDPLLQQDREVRAGRMECTMQNLADALTVRTAERLTATTPAAAAAAAAAAGGSSSAGDVSEELSTFMVYNLRRKVCCCQAGAAAMLSADTHTPTPSARAGSAPVSRPPSRCPLLCVNRAHVMSCTPAFFTSCVHAFPSLLVDAAGTQDTRVP